MISTTLAKAARIIIRITSSFHMLNYIYWILNFYEQR